MEEAIWVRVVREWDGGGYLGEGGERMGWRRLSLGEGGERMG